MSNGGTNPFSPRVLLGMILFGIISFVALLWMIGSGLADPGPQASDAHARSKGLNGYAALYQYLERRGHQVAVARSGGALSQPGLLVLTPLHSADPDQLGEVVENRRRIGPTIIILPKWHAVPLPPFSANANDGFVRLARADTPDWPGFYDDIMLQRGALQTGPRPGGWSAAGLEGGLPQAEKVFSGDGPEVIPLVLGSNTERPLAGYIADGGDYPGLRAISIGYHEQQPDEDEAQQFPVVMVFEPDLFNNWGMNRQANALLAEKLIDATLDGGERRVVFDLTLAGDQASQSLLTLAFTPPFLAATLCLLLAIAAALWRAYRRFGPPLAGGRAIAFGKRALVANAAGLIHRAGRLRLLGPPYADAARERLVKALALNHGLSAEQAEAAIDRALAARAPGSVPFSRAAAALRAARKPTDMLRAARQLHALERTLTR